MTNQSPLKKLITFALLFLTLVFGALIGYRYLHTGKIIVTTNDPDNAIAITKPDGGEVQSTHGNLSQSLRTGTYAITVSGKVLSVSQTVVIKSRQTLRLNLIPPQTTDVEPVTNAAAHSLVADSSKLLYLDDQAAKLVRVGSGNTYSLVAPEQPFDRIRWASADYGIAQDSSNQLFVINQGVATPLQTPENYTKDKTVSFDVTKNKKIYLSFGSNVYVGTDSIPFKKIYTSSTPSPSITASDNNVLLTDTTASGTDAPTLTALLSVVSSTGKLINKLELPTNDNLGAHTSAAWSPSGTKIIVANGGSNSTIFDSSLKKVADLPNSTIGNPTWLNDNELLYSIDNAVWAYNVTSQQSRILSTLTPGYSVNEIAVSSDRSYIYLSVANGGGREVDRIGLSGQKTAELAYQLNVFLPVDFGGICAVGYLNFGPAVPAILLTPFSSTSSGACQLAAQKQLASYDLPVSTLNFVVGPALN